MTLESGTYYRSPSHGWLVVPASLVDAIGAPVSAYDYQLPDGLLALEEDVQMPAFLAKHFITKGADFPFKVRHLVTDFAIRSRPSATPRRTLDFKDALALIERGRAAGADFATPAEEGAA